MSEITLTLKEANDLYPALAELADIPMRGKVASRIGKLFRKIKAELNNFEADRIKVVERLGVLKEPEEATEDNPNKETRWMINKDNIGAYNEELAEMLAETFTMQDVMKIEGSDIEEMEIKPSSLASLEPLINGAE